MTKKKVTAVEAVEPETVVVQPLAAPVEIRNCRVCSRSIRSADPWCTYCIADYPVQWAAVQTPHVDPPEVQRPVDIVLKQVFGSPWRVGGLPPV